MIKTKIDIDKYEGINLDYLIARHEGIKCTIYRDTMGDRLYNESECRIDIDWNFIGQMIGKYSIEFRIRRNPEKRGRNKWAACIDWQDEVEGDTILEAIKKGLYQWCIQQKENERIPK